MPTTATVSGPRATGPRHTVLRALGCAVFVAVRHEDDLAAAVDLTARVLADVDEVASRFRADSDLSRVNAHPGAWVAVDPLLVAGVEVALTAARATDGLVHPLLGRTLVELGYDRDLDLLRETPARHSTAGPAPTPPALDSWREVRTDPDGALRIPAATALDLGATGKAWAADLVGAALEDRLTGGAVVSVGGDLRVAAHPDRDPAEDLPWPVALAEHPGAVPDAVVTLDRGGLATSSTRVRRWTRGGVRHHHLLDPRTGAPTRGPWRTASATGASCAAANTASTAAIVLGDHAPAWLDAHGVDARLVAQDGTVHRTGAWPAPAARTADRAATPSPDPDPASGGSR